MIGTDSKGCLNMPNNMDLKALSERDETVVIVGFFDLTGFAKWSEERPPRELLDLAIALFKRTGRVPSPTLAASWSRRLETPVCSCSRPTIPTGRCSRCKR